MLLSSASNVAMDEKPARILYSPARSIGLFKRYLVVSMFCIKSRDGRKACKDASFAGPIYRPVQTLSGFSRLLATYSMLMFLGMIGYDIFQDSGRFATCKFTISKYAGSTKPRSLWIPSGRRRNRRGKRDGSWPPLGSVRLLRPVISTRILKIEVTLLAASSATIFALKG